SVMQLIDMPPGDFKSGEVLLEGEDLIQKTAKQMEGIRGKEMGMIFQDPMTSLNPTMMIGRQIMEGLIKHQGLSKTEAKKQIGRASCRERGRMKMGRGEVKKRV